MEQFQATIRGKVQGVWFRAWTKDLAASLGLRGWVRNLPDGNVETLAQGDMETLKRFHESLHEGPPLARVSEIDVKWSPADENYTTFSVKY